MSSGENHVISNGEIFGPRAVDTDPPLSWDEVMGLPDEGLTKLVFADDPPERADVAIVVGRHSYRWDLEERAIKGLELFRRGFVPTFVCVGSDKVEGGNRTIGASAAMFMSKILLNGGVPKRNVYVSRERYQSPYSVTRSLQRRGLLAELKTVVIITAPLAAKWNQLWAQWQAGSDVRILMCPHTEGYTAKNWMHSEGGRDAVEKMCHRFAMLESQGLLSLEWRIRVLEEYRRVKRRPCAVT
jgi:hypothetical protein